MEYTPQEYLVAMNHKKLTVIEILRRSVFIIFGSILMGVGLEEFLVPNRILDGGIVGVSIIFSHLIGLRLGVFIFLLNIPFFFLGYKQIGKTFALSTLLGITILSITTSLLHEVPVFTQDPLLATVFGGIVIGAGVGTVIRFGGSLDGTEILAILINKRFPFSVGEIVMFFNIFIFTMAGFVFGWDRSMYSLIAYFIAYKVMDIMITGLDESKSVWIISEKHQLIGETLLARLGRGVTYLSGEGGFTGDNKKVIFCIVSRLEEAKLKSIVEEIDTAAFLAIASISEVRGGRFKKREMH